MTRISAKHLTALALSSAFLASAVHGTVADLEALQAANPNLTFQYGFEGSDDSTRLADQSGNGYTLQRSAGDNGGDVNNIQFLSGFGGVGQAYKPSFDVNDYKTGAGLNTVSTSVPLGATLTIEAVINMDSYQQVLNAGSPSENGSYLIAGRPSGKDRGYFFRQGGYPTTLGESNTLGSTYGDTFTDYVTAINPYTPGDWYYVASVADYNSGTDVTTVTWYTANLTAGDTLLSTLGPDSATFTGDWTGASQVGIGNFLNGGQEYFEGSIDSIAVTDELLDSAQLQTRLDALLVPVPEPSTYALIAGILVLGVALRRRMR